MDLRNILLVDDDPDDRMIIEEALKQSNGTGDMLYATNGENALKMLENLPDQKLLPTLIVLDLNMPKLNGTQTLQRLKQNDKYRHIPVIIYSTSVNHLEKDKCMALGAHDYITKPITIAQSMATADLFLKFCDADQQ
ncbi:MAG: response regulator [Flavitalea sp.]